MKGITLALALLILPLASGADTLIVRNVHGYTLTHDGLQTFSTLIVKDGRVQRLLDTPPTADALVGATIVDGKGSTLLPGLIDAHGHVLGLGMQRMQVELRESTSLADALEQVRKAAASGKGWVLGRGWNQMSWSERRFPTARELDGAVSNRPAMLTRVDGHAVWVNTAALELANVTAETADPPGGRIERDAAGQPTGILVDTAMSLVQRHVPSLTEEETKLALADAMRSLVALGLTAVHDAGIDARQYRAYQELGAAGELPLRIYAMLDDGEAARTMIQQGPRPPQFDDRLQMRAVKASVDGALGSRGAALLQNYQDDPHQRGLMLYTTEQLHDLAKLTAAKGWQLNVHAIGDAGNRAVLDAFETMLSDRQRADLRPRIEHAQVLDLSDLPRFAGLGVIASIQPTHATSDMHMAEARIGARVRGAYAWRDLLNSGARLAGGSDFPVELPDPFLGLYAAVTRQDRDGRPPGGWHPEQKLTREEALRLFTLDAAYAGHTDQSTGSLEPSKWADFILIDRDFFKIPESQIDDIRVLATYVAGKPVGGELL